MNKDSALDYIQNNSIIGVKAGLQRPDFLEIWMVVVQNRVFARSWGLAERSWYNTFLENPIGEIQCGKTIYSIKALIPQDINDLTEEINEAYLTKYNTVTISHIHRELFRKNMLPEQWSSLFWIK